MTRSRGYPHRGGSNKRMTSWLDVEPLSSAIDTSGSVITHSLTAVEKARRPFTIVRTHLLVRITSDQLSADEFQFGALGMCVVSDQAEAIGVTAVPTPITDLASDLWFVHQLLSNEFVFITGAGFDAAGGAVFEIDSKAMRKVNDDEDAIVVVETSSISFGALYQIAGRVLIKEH